jgi:uncharacterized ParB-like nuclease family protein
MKAAITGKPNALFSLREIEEKCQVEARRHAGLQTVQIDRIQGSEGRCGDFDRHFNPMQDHTASRWRGIAKAREEGKSLPPIDVVQIDEVYFVVDGHHRVSVARALGQMEVEAKVTQWDVAGELPWEQQNEERGPSPVSQLFHRIGEGGAWVRDHAWTGMRSLVPA